MKFIAPARIDGTVAAPPSKSLAQRLILAAALAEGGSGIRNAGGCEDVRAAERIARGLGANVRRLGADIGILGGRAARAGRIDCGESATGMRMAAPIAALFPERTALEGSGSLRKRPMGMLAKPLRALGVECETSAGFPPLAVRGPLRGGAIAIDGSLTSQVASGLLMALAAAPGDSEIEIRDLASRGYVDLTVAVMARFGVTVEKAAGRDVFRVKGGQAYRPGAYAVEGDWSAAAFLLVAGAIAGKIEVTNLGADQPDAAILEALAAAGAEVRRSADGVMCRRKDLRRFEFDASQTPDLFPPLAALACFCSGTTTLRGTRRLRHKESDRAAALAEEFGRIGADVALDGDVLKIRGGRLPGGTVLSRGDHRIAMAGAVAALGSEEGVAVEGAECVAKSYPAFFEDLEALKERA